MSILLNSSTMRSLVNSIILGGQSHNYISHHNHHHNQYIHHNHSKQNSFSSAEIMSTITESSNSSIDSGTFDVFDDPDDHFYDEPLLSTCDYHISEDKYRKSSSSSSSSDVISISTHSSSSALESLLGGSSYKPLTNQDNSQQINSHFNQHIQAPSSSSSSNLICSTNKVINKPKLRPPKPPRHINPLTGKKLINSNNKTQSSSTHLPLTLPPKGVRPLSTASSSSGVSSSGSLSPPPLTPVSSPSFKLVKDNLLQEPILSSSPPPPPLPPPSISKKPGRPPPPVPAHPPKPLRKKSEIEPVKHKAENNGSLIVNEVTISQLATIEPIENQEPVTEKIDNKTTSPLTTMAVLNRSRSSQGSFYETAFDSKAILHGDSLHRDQINHISHHTSHHSRQPINLSTYHNQHHHHRSSASNSSVSSFIPDMGNSSQSSTASSTASSSTGHESSSSTPKHLDQLAKSLLPRRQGVKTTVHIPRSKSSDITLNLSAAASNSSSSSSPSPINQNDSSSSTSTSDNKNTSSTSTINQQPAEQSGKRHQRSKLSSLATFSMLKSATSDALSSLDFEAGRVLTRTRSNLDSLRLSIHERNGRINNYNLNKEGIGSCESIESNRNHASISNSRNNISKILTSNNLSSTNNNSNGNSLNNHVNINNKSSNQSSSSILNLNNNTININNNNTNNSSVNKVTVGDKLPANRSFRRLNLKLDETRSSINVPSPKLQSPLNDTRPLDDYDTPWDSNQRLNKVFNKLINTPTSEKFGTECFPNVNSAKVQTPSTESNPINTVSSVNNNINNNITTNTNNNSITNCDNVDNGTIKENLNVKDTGDSCQRVDKIDEQSLQLNQQRKGSNGSTHSSGSSFSSGECETNRPKTPCSLSPSEPIKSENKPERPRKLSLPLNLKNGYETGNSCHSSAPRANLNLDLCNSAADSSPLSPSVLKFGLGPRKKPLLTFTGQPLPVVSEDIDTSLVLEKQGWYHGSITRLDAENLLRNMKEGSYLIRNCESTKQDYSLSLKSVKGFMHMKIVKQSDGKFVLGVFSKPFSSIPEMVKHYSINKLPIRGAEHMSLLYPVIDNLL